MTPAELAALHARCFSVPRPFSATEFESLLDSDLCFLLEVPFGFALGRAVAGEAELLTLAVDPSHRRQGAGAVLLQAFEDEAKGRLADRAFLEAASDNSAARALYARAGYHECGYRKAYYRDADGQTTDAIVMEKPLCLT